MKKVFAAGVVILIVFIIVLQFIPLGIEPLTELYFENHTKLPVYIFPMRYYNFSFTIHNLEYQEMGYNYSVDVYKGDDFWYTEDFGRVIIADNESVTLFEDFALSRGFDRAKVQVNIKKDDLGIVPDFKKKLWWPDPNYPENVDIHFWVEEIVGTTITRN
jgi:hypothetical protein